MEMNRVPTKKKVRSARYEYSRRPLRTFLAAAVNVFGGRYEPEKSGIHPTDIRPFSLFEPTFLPACSEDQRGRLSLITYFTTRLRPSRM